MSRDTRRLSVRDLVILALMGALMMGTKVALALLPNVHLIAVLIILTVLVFGRRAFYSVFVYILLEGLIYGFGIWFVSYLYVWPLLTAVALLMRRNRSWLLWAVVAALHGLLFGALTAIPYIFISGVSGAAAYWISGIPYDCIHAGSNFVLTLVLLKPLYSIVSRFAGKKT